MRGEQRGSERKNSRVFRSIITTEGAARCELLGGNEGKTPFGWCLPQRILLTEVKNGYFRTKAVEAEDRTTILAPPPPSRRTVHSHRAFPCLGLPRGAAGSCILNLDYEDRMSWY